MRTSQFRTLLVLAVLITIGAAVLPRIDIAEQPRARQGRRLTVVYSWHGISAKAVEQNVTARLEGLVSAVKGVAATESESHFGGGSIVVELKPEVSVSAARFEILSLLRQTYKSLPAGVGFPSLYGGEVVTNSNGRETEQLLLSYVVNANMGRRQLRELISAACERRLGRDKTIKRLQVSGATSKYIELTYDPALLAVHGVTAADIEDAIMSFMGRRDVVGETLDTGQRRMTVYLTTEAETSPLLEIPLGRVGDKTLRMGDLVSFDYKDMLPDEYFRVNGLNTVYLNVYIDAQTDKISASRQIRKEVGTLEEELRGVAGLALNYDAAENAQSELTKLVWRTALALVILLGFVWLTSRSWRYLGVIAVSLLADVLISALFYWLLDIRLHIYSLAGITVSMGMIIDATVVMSDHYRHYRDRKAFLSILAALLTTIGSLVVVFWLPEHIQNDMYDFALIIMVNLTVALCVAFFFVPALTEAFGYGNGGFGTRPMLRAALRWKSCYMHYITITQRHRWVYIVLVALIFGLPFYALPTRIGSVWEDSHSRFKREGSLTKWAEQCYNRSFGSDVFQRKIKPVLGVAFGGTLRIFSNSLSSNRQAKAEEQEKHLLVRAQMPLGGTVEEMNEKVILLETFLSQFRGIERFETRVGQWGATVEVRFTKEAGRTDFPYKLENMVVGRIISIGGADWGTSGVSELGFSNSINLLHRGKRIELAGYNYDRLNRLAEELCAELGKNRRVADITIETPGHEREEDELYVRYDHERMALYGFDLAKAYGTLREMLSESWIRHYKDKNLEADLRLLPSGYNDFDLWHLNNAQIKTGDENLTLSDFMRIDRREANSVISRRNQEYVLRVAFNMLGPETYVNNYIAGVTERFNASAPVGFQCRDVSYGFDGESRQYWMLLVVLVIIYFICAILFESLSLPLSILSLVPLTFVGAFITYILTGIPFGTGGFAALVLLAGLTVNAGIYIVVQYGSEKSREGNKVAAYVRAYNHKINAVFLTLLSTILGLIPFFIDSHPGDFWFSFAAGASGGLLFSVIALIFFMPVTIRLTEKD